MKDKKVYSSPPKTNPQRIFEEDKQRCKALLDKGFADKERAAAKTDLERAFLEGEIRIAHWKQSNGLLD